MIFVRIVWAFAVVGLAGLGLYTLIVPLVGPVAALMTNVVAGLICGLTIIPPWPLKQTLKLSVRETQMPKFRKRPVVIEAWRWEGQLPHDRPEWVNGGGCYLTHDCTLIVPTLEGDMAANRGDWIIRGVKGEVYPCKPDIFAATYDPE